jgi:histidinol-phosphate aminotransferase
MKFKDHIQQLPAYKPNKLIVQQSAGITKLSSNENPLGPSPRAIAALSVAVTQVHRYPDAQAVELRSAIGARYGLPLEAVMCSNGSDELILLLCLAMLNAGDEVVMAQGTFISYYLRTLELAATPIRVPLHNYRHDLMALADAITPQTRMVFVCNPNNPTGTSNGDAELRAFLARVPDDVLVVVDEAYIEFVNRADFPDLLSDVRAGQPNLLLLRTFAKIHGLAGLRLGYALGAPSLINYLEKTRPTFNVNLLAQVAGLAALNDEEHLARSKAHADTSRTYFERELTALGLEAISSETNFVAFAVGDDGAVSDALRERGFSVTPLSGWGLPGVIRVSFGTMAQNEAFIGALQEVIADSR